MAKKPAKKMAKQKWHSIREFAEGLTKKVAKKPAKDIARQRRCVGETRLSAKKENGKEDGKEWTA